MAQKKKLSEVYDPMRMLNGTLQMEVQNQLLDLGRIPLSPQQRQDTMSYKMTPEEQVAEYLKNPFNTFRFNPTAKLDTSQVIDKRGIKTNPPLILAMYKYLFEKQYKGL